MFMQNLISDENHKLKEVANIHKRKNFIGIQYLNIMLKAHQRESYDTKKKR